MTKQPPVKVMICAYHDYLVSHLVPAEPEARKKALEFLREMSKNSDLYKRLYERVLRDDPKEDTIYTEVD